MDCCDNDDFDNADDFSVGCFDEYGLTFLLADVENLPLALEFFGFEIFIIGCHMKSRTVCSFKCGPLICQHG